ncbi:MAG TPA: type II secretion system protein [Oligoflexia bacterium]|nr:type II secretion system protein [Oligoflexia bacterium]
MSKRFLSERGFTLIEMLLLFVVLAIMGMLAVLEFRPAEASFQRMNARSFLIQDLKRAQAEAITWGCRGIFMIAADSNGYSFGCDFLAYDESETPAADRVFFSREMPMGIIISASQPVIFNSRGQAVDLSGVMTNTILLCKRSRVSRVHRLLKGPCWGRVCSHFKIEWNATDG